MRDLDPIKAAVEPVAEQIHRLIEKEIHRHLEPLERRITELERQVRSATAMETETPPVTPLDNPEE